MKTVNHSLWIVGMRTIGGGTLILVVAGGFLVSCHRAAPLPQLNIADSPVPRENRPELSFAPVVKKVSPSVVNIYTAKTVQENPHLSRLSEDPIFRQFFGEAEGYGRVPRERREQSLGFRNHRVARRVHSWILMAV
jgi:S1-C subfamily serine protease